MVAELFYDSRIKFLHGKLHLRASVVLEVHRCACRLLIVVVIGERIIDDPFVLMSGREEVSGVFLWVILVELVDLRGLVSPNSTSYNVRLFHLHRNGLCLGVVESIDNRNGLIASSFLEEEPVLVFVSRLIVERVILFVKPVIHIILGGISFPLLPIAVILSDGEILLYSDFCSVDDFVARGDMNGSVKHFAEHIHPDVVELSVCTPVTEPISLRSGGSRLPEALSPDKLRPVEHTCTVVDNLVEHRSNTDGFGISTISFVITISCLRFLVAIGSCRNGDHSSWQVRRRRVRDIRSHCYTSMRRLCIYSTRGWPPDTACRR